MALQLSINEMKGTIGNLTYYKSKDGFRVRRKTSLNKSKNVNWQKSHNYQAEYGRIWKCR